MSKVVWFVLQFVYLPAMSCFLVSRYTDGSELLFPVAVLCGYICKSFFHRSVRLFRLSLRVKLGKRATCAIHVSLGNCCDDVERNCASDVELLDALFSC